MTNAQLIKRLQQFPPELPVYTYVEEAEEAGMTESVDSVESVEDFPYVKGDKPEFSGTVLVIKGWIAS